MDPELEKLLNMLGCSTVAEAQNAIAKFNAFLTDARVATATTTMVEAQSALASQATVVRQLDALTGKSGAESVATVLAWKQGAEAGAKAAADLAAFTKAQAASEATAKIDAAIADGRLEPANRAAMQAMFDDFGAKALDNALAMLPKSAPVNNGSVPKAPAPTSTVVNGLTDEERAIARQMGVPDAELVSHKQALATVAV